MNTHTARTEGRRSWVAATLLLPLYGALKHRGVRAFLRKLALRTEGGAMYSLTVREMLHRHHGVEVGLYTIGPCEAGPDGLDPGTVIGRYCSIYYTVKTICDDELARADDPAQLYFPSALGLKAAPTVNSSRLVIGHDVFIGHNAVILATAGEIGDGAFIGAGAIVHKPVPPYAVVMGNPARVVRYRFSEGTIKEQLASQWWLKSLQELGGEMDSFRNPLEGAPAGAQGGGSVPQSVAMERT